MKLPPPLTYDACGEVSVADAYVCRWSSVLVPIRPGLDVTPIGKGPVVQMWSCAVRAFSVHTTKAVFKAPPPPFYELVLYWSVKFYGLWS